MRQRGGGKLFTSVNNSFIVHEIPGNENNLDPLAFLQATSSDVQTILRDGLNVHSNVRWYLSLEITFERHSEDGVAWIESRFTSTPFILQREDEINEQIDRAVSIIVSRIEDFIEMGSGWQIKNIKALSSHIAAFNPIGGSSHIPTPKRLLKTGGIINVQNEDEYCFLYSVLAHIHPASRNAQRPSKYSAYLSELNVKGLKFPVTAKQIPKFEEMNPSISINVLHLDPENSIVPLYSSPLRNRQH
jgi:hypothetical protein